MQASTESAPDEKSKKYDRQLRLWGEHGQEALEKAKVCLINATATGTEILKNLILPGIGSFTIVDGHKTLPEDAGNNFFLDKDSIGKGRAQAATELLSELNEDVTGYFIEDSVEELLANNCIFYSNFNIVIATDLCEETLLRLADLLHDYEIPLLVCRSYGFVGYMRMVLKEHTVVESHPDSAHEDLRLDRPIGAFVTYCDSLDMEAMNKKDHSHTPWLVVMYKYLLKWKTQHNDQAPKNYREKTEFKELIRSGIRLRDGVGVPEDEENFDEAIRNVNTTLLPTKVPSQVQELFNDKNCANVGTDSDPFWLLLRAVKEFVSNEGKGALPVRGSIPDMTADSERYIQLQNIYKQQAEADVMAVTNHLHSLISQLGMDEPVRKRQIRSPSTSPAKPQDSITDSDIKLFCKSASFLRVIRTRSLEEEYKLPYAKSEDIGNGLDDTDFNDTVLYVMLRAVGRFYTEFKRYPGTDNVEADIPKVKTCLTKLLQDWGVTQTIKDDYVHEFCRYGASELHSVAAYMGGAVAQEVIKVLTRQFVPINNTYIYNAVKQTSCSLEL